MLKSALSLLLLSCLLGRLDCTELTVKQGADATLQCSGHRDADAIMIRWNKSELQSEDYVFYFKDGHFQEELQHELFKGRVELKGPDWKKTGDFSVILKHVTTNDAGTYECYAGYEGQRPELLSSLILKVEKPGQQGGQSGDGGKEDGGEKSDSVGLIVGLSVPAVLFIGLVGFLIYKKCLNQSNPDYQPPPDRDIELPEVSS